MTERNDNDFAEEFDPRLQAMLDELRQTPPRNPEAVAQGQARFLTELDSLMPKIQAAAPAKQSWFGRLFAGMGGARGGFGQRVALTSLVAVIVVLALLLGGAGMTALAARSALPGDALYGVKTRIEETQVRLAGDAARQVELHLQLAQRRLDEIEKLIAEGRYNNINQAVQEFQRHIQDALVALNQVSAGDPVRAAELSLRITQELTRYAQALSGMANGLPEAVRSELENALQLSENALSGSSSEFEFSGMIEQLGMAAWRVGGRVILISPQTEIKGIPQVGWLVKVHVIRQADQSLVAREIEILSPADNENGNGNTNTNGNMNTNANQNANANQNTNTNSNANDDDHHDDNANQNQNTNTNDRDEDDNGNSINEDGDDNGDDNSNGNQNTNDDDNRNNNENGDNDGDNGKNENGND